MCNGDFYDNWQKGPDCRDWFRQGFRLIMTHLLANSVA